MKKLLLLLAALIWGVAFVAQSVGMDYMGPFTFNGARFLMGSAVLLPVILFRRKTARRKLFCGEFSRKKFSCRKIPHGKISHGKISHGKISLEKRAGAEDPASPKGERTGKGGIHLPGGGSVPAPYGMA